MNNTEKPATQGTQDEGVLDTTFVIKFVSDLRQVGGFLPVSFFLLKCLYQAAKISGHLFVY
jgi:hypothetical protein